MDATQPWNPIRPLFDDACCVVSRTVVDNDELPRTCEILIGERRELSSDRRRSVPRRHHDAHCYWTEHRYPFFTGLCEVFGLEPGIGATHVLTYSPLGLEITGNRPSLDASSHI